MADLELYTEKELVGWLVLEETRVVRQHYEYAAWWTDIEVPAGRYPIYIKRGRYGTRNGYVSCTARGTVVSSYTAAHFGGMPVSTQPQREQHRSVGRPMVATLLYAHNAARWLGQRMAGEYNPHSPGREELLSGLWSRRTTYMHHHRRLPGRVMEAQDGTRVRTWQPTVVLREHHQATRLKALPPSTR